MRDEGVEEEMIENVKILERERIKNEKVRFERNKIFLHFATVILQEVANHCS
jgi:hypothetical protein